ncbi:MAG: type II toxin-antitoxin system RelE/ParE family toxin [Candidatus Marinimicrobia bacterium]|nr:type II toxin-antitoxin system RelE/ParE family toxin [Candidatus Neomarinimicrobiota bacterium]
MYSLFFLKKAKAEFKRIDPIWQKRIQSKLEILTSNPVLLKNQIKPLKGKQGLASLRVGSYRVIFQKKNKELIILIIRVSHRRKVYGK